MKKQRLYYLDFIRVICMFIILYYHFAICVNQWTPLDFNLPSTLSNGADLGEIAVAAFFMISGASLFYTYGDKEISIKQYYWKRFKSIYPLFWITWIIFYLLYFYFVAFSVEGDVSKWTILLSILGEDHYISAVFGIKTFAVIGEWFLGCILIIYLLFPFIRIAIIKIPKLFLSMILVMYFIIYLSPIDSYIPYEGFNLSYRIVEFTIGIYILKFFQSKYNMFGMLSIIIFMGLNCLPIYSYGRPFIDVFNICFFITLLYVWRLFDFKIIRKLIKKISSYSYVVFLIHHVIMYIIFINYIRKSPPVTDLGFTSVSNVICLAAIISILIVIGSYFLVQLESAIMTKIISNILMIKKNKK